MTATEIIYAIREKLKAYTDDSRYTDSYLYYLINLKRSLFIRREYNQLQRTIDTEVLQSICMELEEVADSVCPECYTGCSECTIMRTKLVLPKTIELHNRNTITKIGTVGAYDRPYNFVTMDRMPYVGHSKYENNFVFGALYPDGHLYFKSNSSTLRSIEYISVTALFENPDDVSAFECNGSVCYNSVDYRFPIKAWMTDIIINEIVSELANLKQLQEDTNNNAKEDN